MAEIPLRARDGSVRAIALVDDEDYEFLTQFRWSLSTGGYAHRSGRRGEGVTNVRMHRVVARTPADMECDHINRNRLDNRRSNLRNVTHRMNGYNRSDNKSGIPGVSWNVASWRVQFSENGVNRHFGSYKTLEEATAVRDREMARIQAEAASNEQS